MGMSGHRPGKMRALVLERSGLPLQPRRVSIPRPGAHDLLVRVLACAVCRTDLHVVDGELPDARLPIVPGHEIVGAVAERGPRVTPRRGAPITSSRAKP
jgi:propanol-preferring alcohol dehydrogenase